MTATMVEERVDTRPVTGGGEGKLSHIVFVPASMRGEHTPQSFVLLARVEGVEVEALCGHLFFPNGDPHRYPVCQTCVDIYHQPGDQRDSRDELPDA